jgi:protocatechuate 3,4-dioxygenase beta subunit
MSISYSYLPNAPLTTTLASPDLKGERLIISGTVYASDRVTPLPAVQIEVWQADADGRYGRLRAQMQTDAEGRYQFTTVKPGHYKVDCRPMPAHIHYRARYLDNEPLFLTLFVEDDPYLTNLPVGPASLRPLATWAGADGPVLHTTFDIVLPVNLGSGG